MSLDAATLRQRFEPKPGKVLENGCEYSAARFSPCGRWLAAAGYDGLVHRWDAAAEGLPELAPLTGHGGWVQEVDFAPDGSRMFSADSWGQLKAWSLGQEPPGEAWSAPAAHDGWIVALAVSPDGQRLATGGIDRKLRVWQATDAALLLELDHPEPLQSVRFHPGGASLVTGDAKGAVRHWDLPSGQCLRTLDAGVLFKLDRLQDVGGVRCLSFNGDGTLLACGGTLPSVGGNVQGVPAVLIFDWASGELKHKLELGGSGDVYATDVAFHPEGFVMATVSGNPGAGKIVFRMPAESAAFFETTHIPNCHSLALDAGRLRLAIVGTSANSNGNGRVLDAKGEYASNWSPIHVLELPAG
jgi:WD40 repeat protein